MSTFKALEDVTVTLKGCELLWLIQVARKEHDNSVSEEFGENCVSLKWKGISDKLNEAWNSLL